MSEEPLLRAREARIAVDDVVAMDRLTFDAPGDRVLLVGEVTELVAVLTGVPLAARARRDVSEELPGEARIVGGSLFVAGKSVAAGGHLGPRGGGVNCGTAPLDPPLPADWTAEQYVAWSARLSGASARAARELAGPALSRVGLGALRRRVLGALAVPERRALLLAHAIVTSPEVIIAEAPLSGLEGAAFDFVLAAVSAATEGRRAILSGARIDPGAPESVLSRAASHIVVLLAGEIALEGAPSDLFSAATIFGLTVRSNTEPFRTELASRGIALRGGPIRFSAALPEGATSTDILAAARAADAALVELVPLV
jgi:ABC-2 type transport system ATP-binding protein